MTIFIVAALLGLAVIALPYVASNQIVRNRIALEMAAWSGFEVTIGATPAIEIWPNFRAILTEVKLTPWTDTEGKPVIEAERVEIGLSALAALRGNVVFSSARLIRPTIRVARNATGALVPLLPMGGRIAHAVDQARDIVAADRNAPDTARLPADSFGVVEFQDGRIVADDGRGGPEELVSSLAGRVDWIALNRSASLSARGIWRGEEVAVEASSPGPLVLFGGGNAAVKVKLTSPPATFGFDGNANLDDFYVDGKATFATPSLRRLLDWSQAGVSAVSGMSAVAVDSRVTGNAERLRFDSTTITIDKNPATGVLDVQSGGRVPVVAGTLAFETVDLSSLLSAFTPIDGGTGGEPASASLTDRVDLDLRLSSERASFGSVAMTGIAATARVNADSAVFDVSDGRAFGGTIQAGVSFDRKAPEMPVQMRLLATDIDGGALGAAVSMTRLVPIGRGTVSVDLKGPDGSWNAILGNSRGAVTATFGAGALSNFNIDRFLDRSKRGGFFALQEVADGNYPMQGLTVKASISSGTATIESAEAWSDRSRIVISGIVPSMGGGLALSGSVLPPGKPVEGAEPGPAIATFFVGGSWSTPFVSPIPNSVARD